MGILDLLKSISEIGEEDKKKKEEEEKKKQEEEMKTLDLEEWEKEKVRKGEADPWNFDYDVDEEDAEDDDYYGEDI